MDLIPISVNAGHEPGNPRCVHVFAGPMFVRADGKLWRRIEDVAKVSLDPATLAWEVSCAGNWVSLVPQDRGAVQDNTARIVSSGKRFGHVLRAGHGLRELRYRVEASPGAKETPDGWLLAECDGVRLGLWLRDWKVRFGPRLRRTGNILRLDLDGLPEAELNLDPTTVLSSNDHQHVPAADESWDVVHDAVASDNVDSPGLGIGTWYMGGAYDLRRSLVRFETSGYAVTKAEFFAFIHLPFTFNPPDARWKAGDDLGGVSFNTTAEYPACLLTGTTDTLTVVNDPDDGWRKADVTSVFAASNKFDVVLGEGRDADDEAPLEEDVRLGIFDTSVEDNPPRLELTLAGSGGGTRRMLTGVGT